MAKLKQQVPVHIVAVLDRSGSMGTIVDASVSGFNEFLDVQKKLPGEAKISVVLFDDKYQVWQDDVDVKECPPITAAIYAPNGMTALHDAIGKSLTALFKENPERAIVCILTDGYENASKEFNAGTTKSLIEKARKRGWEVVYLAANQDAFSVGTQMGVSGSMTRSFVADAQGTQTAFTSTSALVSNYRSS